MTTLSERLKLVMKGPPKITQMALAKACNVTAPSVNEWISGEIKNIVGETLFLAAEFLKVEPKWLACGKGPMRPSHFNNDKKRYAIIEHIINAPSDKLDKIEGDVIQICEPEAKYGNHNDNGK